MTIYFYILYFRTYTNETSQFLAPYDVSIKQTNPDQSVTMNANATFVSEHSVVAAQPKPSIAHTSNAMQSAQLNTSVSNSDVSRNDKVPQQRSWNPFEDPTPFNQMTEDHIIDEEFEKIGQRGSQSSKILNSIAAMF